MLWHLMRPARHPVSVEAGDKEFLKGALCFNTLYNPWYEALLENFHNRALV